MKNISTQELREQKQLSAQILANLRARTGVVANLVEIEDRGPTAKDKNEADRTLRKKLGAA